MPLLSLKNISKDFDTQKVLKDISFEVEGGSFISIFGPNGSGKTTLLNVISGLTKQDAGDLIWTGKNSIEKSVAYVFQNYRETLFPWKRIWENISLPLKLQGFNKRECKLRAIELTNKFSIDIDLEKFPYELSGGQQQLIAILRAIIIQPELLLLDEPFSALDFSKKLSLQFTLLKIWEETKITIIFISHDLEEAIFMADRVILLGGKPSQIVEDINIEIARPRNAKTLTNQICVNYRDLLLNSFLQYTKPTT